MSNKTRTFIFIIAALVVIGGIGYYNIKKDITGGADTPDVIANEDKEIRTDTNVPIDETEKDTTAKNNDADGKTPIAGTVSAIATAPVPDLGRPVIFPGGYSVEDAKKITGQVAILVDALKADSNRFNEWLDLGLLLKSIEDYEGARQAWEYASSIRPGNSLSFVNLGMLYGYYLNEPIKAEANLLHAIENEPRFLDFYARMADFYLEVMKDKGKAIDFLDRAIEKYPEWTEIKDLKDYIIK